MKKSKILLLFSILILLLPFRLKINSKYSNEEKIEGIINNYQIDGNKLSLEIIGKEKIIGNYFFKTEEEKKKYMENIELGFKITLYGNLKEPSSNRNFNLFNYKKYLMSKKIYWLFSINNFEIQKTNQWNYQIKNKIIKRIEKYPNSDYLKTFLLGENNLEEEVKETYQINGINHLFAISGMHITILTTILFYILNKISNNKIINFLLICFFLFFYLFLTNYTPSVVRSSLFFIFLNIKKIRDWKISNLTLIFLLFLLLLNNNPYYIYHPGFVYSFIISMGLIYFQNKLENKNYIKRTLILSILTFLLSFPLNIYYSNSINLFSPLFNILFVPFVSIVIFPVSLLTFFFPFIHPLLTILLTILEAISLSFSKLDYLTIPLKTIPIFFLMIYYIVILLIIKKQSFKLSILLIFMVFFHFHLNWFNPYPILTMIDVGQGDSILIELPYNKGNILIDTGGTISFNEEKWKKRKEYNLSKNVIIPYLKSRGIKKIDYLILTHGDIDHAKGAIYLLKNFPIKKVLLNSGEDTPLEKEIKEILKVQNISYQQISTYQLYLDKYIFYFLNKKNEKNENEDSLIVYTKLNHKNILLMGDSGEQTEKFLIQEYNLPNMDILKVGHHGSKNSSSNQFIEKITPKISLISAGINNSFHHPHQETLNKLKKIHSDIYITSLHGMIRLRLESQIKIAFPVR